MRFVVSLILIVITNIASAQKDYFLQLVFADSVDITEGDKVYNEGNAEIGSVDGVAVIMSEKHFIVRIKGNVFIPKTSTFTAKDVDIYGTTAIIVALNLDNAEHYAPSEIVRIPSAIPAYIAEDLPADMDSGYEEIELPDFLFDEIEFAEPSTLNKNDLLNQIANIRDMPYICEETPGSGIGCGDVIFWNIVRQNIDIVPMLIEKLTDTTPLKDVYVPNFGGLYAVADVADVAIGEIIHGIPTLKLMGVEFDQHGCGYCVYWNYLRADIHHREKFQAAMATWYAENASKLVWIESNAFESMDCPADHPAGGHYEVRP